MTVLNTHDVLTRVVERVRCKPGWTFRLVTEHESLLLMITVPGWDASGASTTDRLLGILERIRNAQTPIDGAEVDQTVKAAYGEHDRFTVRFPFPVPTATYNERTWRRWVFDCCRRVENHELGEWFRDGSERPFAPLHGPGEDPFTVHEFRPVTDALTTQAGSLREPYE